MAKVSKAELNKKSAIKTNHKIFLQLLGSTLVASVVNMTVWFAITFFVYLQTRSVFATAIIAGLYLVFVAVSGFWLGSLVDHHKKKTVMLWSSYVSLAAYILTFVMYLALPPQTYTDPSNPLLWLFVVAIMAGVLVGNMRHIALMTTITILIPEDRRDKANGLVGSAMGISFLITSVISGILVGISGMFWVLILGIVTMVGVILHLFTVTIPEKGIVHVDGQPKVDIKGTLKVIAVIPGLIALILFTAFNNFLGGVYMALMDAYGLSMVSVEVWGFIWAFLSTGFIVGGLIIAKVGLGKNPLRALFIVNIILWVVSALFTIQPWLILLVIGMYVYMVLMPYAEAAEQTILQKVVPPERQGRVFGFAQSVEMSAAPLTAFVIGPIAQFIFIPFMTTGAGVDLIGWWFGAGPARGIALVFTLTAVVGLIVTLLAFASRFYKQLSAAYQA